MTTKRKMVPLLALWACGIAGCVILPTGPSHMALPGSGKDFDQFPKDGSSATKDAIGTCSRDNGSQRVAGRNSSLTVAALSFFSVRRRAVSGHQS